MNNKLGGIKQAVTDWQIKRFLFYYIFLWNLENPHMLIEYASDGNKLNFQCCFNEDLNQILLQTSRDE